MWRPRVYTDVILPRVESIRELMYILEHGGWTTPSLERVTTPNKTDYTPIRQAYKKLEQLMDDELFVELEVPGEGTIWVLEEFEDVYYQEQSR